MDFICNKINKAFDESKGFLESSIIQTMINKKLYYAFPHYKGKNRATEFGGTSSALSALSVIDKLGYKNRKVNKALLWLYEKQKSGSWQSKDIYCSHVTAGILCDLYEYDLDVDIKQKALNYIISCYNKEGGYFLSYETDSYEPKIYVTYICMKALELYGNKQYIDLDKVRVWIEKGCNRDGGWGINVCDSHSTLTHTIYALRILNMCGISKSELREKYRLQIKWLLKNITTYYGRYDVEEIIKQVNNDEYGIIYKEIPLHHLCLSEIGLFFLDFKSCIYATTILKQVIQHQYNGGWGITYNRLTMWETQINLRFLSEYKEKYQESSSVIRGICNIVFNVSLNRLLFSLSIIIMAISFIWIIAQKERIDGLIVSLMASIIISLLGNMININRKI